MQFYKGKYIAEPEREEKDGMFLISVEENRFLIFKRNVGDALWDWICCGAIVWLMASIGLLENPLENMEQLPLMGRSIEMLMYAYIFVVTCVRILSIYKNRNTDLPWKHCYGYAIGICIGFVLFKFNLKGLLLFKAYYLLRYWGAYLVVLFLWNTLCMILEKLEREWNERKETEADSKGR